MRRSIRRGRPEYGGSHTTTPLVYGGGGPDVAQDTLIFRVTPDGLSLVGGNGRGAGWGGIMDLPMASEDFVARVHQSGQLARVGDGGEPSPVSMVSADLDNLKATNDRDGHAAGDEIIRTTARLLRDEARTADRVARVGGDEFLIMLPETDLAGAEQFVARVRAESQRVLADGLNAVALSLGAAMNDQIVSGAATAMPRITMARNAPGASGRDEAVVESMVPPRSVVYRVTI